MKLHFLQVQTGTVTSAQQEGEDSSRNYANEVTELTFELNKSAIKQLINYMLDNIFINLHFLCRQTKNERAASTS